MSRRVHPLDLVFGLWALGLTIWFGAQFALGAPAEGAFGVDVALRIGGPSKWLALLLATVFSWRMYRALEADAPPRRGWLAFLLGSGSFCFGQGVLVVHQLFIEGDTPFPSAADPAFVLGYLAMGLALVMWLRAFTSSGMLPPLPRLRVWGLLPGLFVAASAWLLILGTMDQSRPWLERAFALGYPSLDAALLVPTSMLAYLALRVFGGELARPWLRLALGVLLLCVGDVLFALPTEGWALGPAIARAEPLVDLSFALGYLAVAWSCVGHEGLLRGRD